MRQLILNCNKAPKNGATLYEKLLNDIDQGRQKQDPDWDKASVLCINSHLVVNVPDGYAKAMKRSCRANKIDVEQDQEYHRTPLNKVFQTLEKLGYQYAKAYKFADTSGIREMWLMRPIMSRPWVLVDRNTFKVHKLNTLPDDWTDQAERHFA